MHSSKTADVSKKTLTPSNSLNIDFLICLLRVTFPQFFALFRVIPFLSNFGDFYLCSDMVYYVIGHVTSIA